MNLKSCVLLINVKVVLISSLNGVLIDVMDVGLVRLIFRSFFSYFFPFWKKKTKIVALTNTSNLIVINNVEKTRFNK